MSGAARAPLTANVPRSSPDAAGSRSSRRSGLSVPSTVMVSASSPLASMRLPPTVSAA